MPANQIQYSEKYYDEVGGCVHIMSQVVSLPRNAPSPLLKVGPRLTVRLLCAQIYEYRRAAAHDNELSWC